MIKEPDTQLSSHLLFIFCLTAQIVYAITGSPWFVANQNVGSHSLVVHFLKRSLRVRPLHKVLMPSWDHHLNPRLTERLERMLYSLLLHSWSDMVNFMPCLWQGVYKKSFNGSGVTLWPNPLFPLKELSVFHNQPINWAVLTLQTMVEKLQPNVYILCPVYT